MTHGCTRRRADPFERSARVAPHGGDRRCALAEVDLASDLEAVAAVERHVPDVRALEVGGHALGIAAVEHLPHQDRADTGSLLVLMGADRLEEVVLLGRVHLLDRAERADHPRRLRTDRMDHRRKQPRHGAAGHLPVIRLLPDGGSHAVAGGEHEVVRVRELELDHRAEQNPQLRLDRGLLIDASHPLEQGVVREGAGERVGDLPEIVGGRSLNGDHGSFLRWVWFGEWSWVTGRARHPRPGRPRRLPRTRWRWRPQRRRPSGRGTHERRSRRGTSDPLLRPRARRQAAEAS